MAENDDLISILDFCRRPTLLVVGDIMLDRFVWGRMERVSPEAPVGVVETEGENAVLGGAGNVARNLRALECKVYLCGVVGDDPEGRVLLHALRQCGISEEGIFKTTDRPTTVKTRVMVQGQQVIRLDRESKSDIPKNVERGILHFVEANISSLDGVLLSDYGKGVLTDRLTPSLIQMARESRKPIIVDPKGSDFAKYAGANLLKPNLREASVAASMQIDGKDSLMRAGSILLEKLGSDVILVTKGKEGMTLFHGRNSVVDIPVTAREVYDITGAGDTVLSVLGLVLCSGFNYISAAKIANVAAGIVVGKVGTAVVTRDEIRTYLEGDPTCLKVKGLDELRQIVSRLRGKGKKIVFTNGCFDLLHIGHVVLLQRAKSLGHVLVVGLNSDASVRMLKGDQRPIIPEEARARILASLEYIDYVTIFTDPTPLHLIETLKPDVLVKGANWSPDEIVGREVVESYGGRVELVPLVEGISTTRVVERIRSQGME